MQKELPQILLAILIFGLVASFNSIMKEHWPLVFQSFIFAAIIILIHVGAKKLSASSVDANIEHELWTWRTFGFRPHQHFKTPLPAGIIFPLGLSFFSLGLIKFPAILTYETRALKRRAAKRFGYYSFAEMTDDHNARIGSAGIIALLLLTIVAYFLPYQGLEQLAKLSTYYALANLIPISKLDGTQIFFGGKTRYTVLLVITLLFTALALII